MLATAVKTRVLAGFDDPVLGRERWNALVAAGDTPVPYLTWEFQRAWWDTLGTHGGGDLLLIAAERNGEPVALAPFFVDGRMVFFVGTSFEFDYLDFIGDVSDATVMEALLSTACDAVPRLYEFFLSFLPDRSRTAELLGQAARRLDLELTEDA